MADNIAVTAGSGTTIAADDIGGVLHQRVKLSQGADGSATDVSSAAPLNVTLANTGANATPLVVDLGANNDVSVNAGTNYIGKVRLTDGTTDGEVVPLAGYNAQAVAIVDGSGSQITSFGGGVQYTEGDTDASFTGTMMLAEAAGNTAAALQIDASGHLQVDLAASSTSVTVSDGGGSITVDNNGTFVVQSTNQANSGVDIGDVTINNASGASAVNIQDGGNSITVDGTVAVSGTVTVASHAVTNAGTFATQESGALLTSSQLIDDAIVADNAAFTDGTTKLDMAGYIYDEVAGTALTENDAAAARINVNRAQVQAIEDGSTRGRYATVTASNALKVDGSAVTQPVSGTVTITPSGTQTVSGTVAVSTINSVAPAFGSGVRGATVQRVTIATDDVVPITDNAGSLTVDAPVGTPVFVRLSDGSSAIATLPVSMATNTPVGNVAHDSADSGAPIKVGGRARSSEITAIASDDRSDFVTDLVGKQIVLPYANPENFVSGAITTSMTGTTSTSLVAAPGAGLRNYITTIIVSNAHGTVGTDVAIQDGSGGTTLMTVPAAAVYGGAVINLPVPLRQPTTNTALFCANVTTGANTKVSAVGYKGV